MMRRPRYVIAVHDVERSARFYENVLGFEIREIGDPGWRLEVDDIDELHAALRAKDVTITKALRQEPWGMREFGIRTLDGHRIMFGSAAEPPSHEV